MRYTQNLLYNKTTFPVIYFKNLSAYNIVGPRGGVAHRDTGDNPGDLEAK